MKDIKINYCDFWPGFDKNNNYFSNIISKYYNITISENPDILLFSVFGCKHKNFNCKKIIYIGENIRPNYYETDYSISFDFQPLPRNFRWPLYNLYYDPNISNSNNNIKNKFCCMVTSNPNGKFRNYFYEKLNSKQVVDSGGKYKNNVGGPVPDKIEFLSNYRFSLAIENSSYPGYATEKIIESKKAGTIPIYWGNPRIAEDFNVESFINIHSFKSVDSCIDYVLEVNSNEELYQKIGNMPLLIDNSYTEYSNEHLLIEWLCNVIDYGPRYVDFNHSILSGIEKAKNALITSLYNYRASKIMKTDE